MNEEKKPELSAKRVRDDNAHGERAGLWELGHHRCGPRMGGDGDLRSIKCEQQTNEWEDCRRG